MRYSFFKNLDSYMKRGMISKLSPYVICVVFIIFFSWWSNPGLKGHRIGDSDGYVDVALETLNEDATSRPIGYPLVIRLSMFLAGGEGKHGAAWPRLVVIMQMISLSALISAMFWLYTTLGISPWIALPAALAVGVNPNTIRNVGFIIPELLLGVIISLAWIQLVRLYNHKHAAWKKVLGKAALIGGLSGLALLFKPVWILGIVPLMAGAGLVFIARPKIAGAVMGVMLLTHVVIWWSWQVFLLIHFNQIKPSVASANMFNFCSIRAGLTHHAEGTPLYHYMEEKGILDEAKSLTWHDFEKWSRIRQQIGYPIRYDETFYRAVFAREIMTLIKIQISRWPKFFTTRTPFPRGGDDYTFPLMPSFVRYLYYGSYNWLFRPIGPILLILSLVYGMYNPRLRPVTISAALIILYFSSVVTFSSYQNPLFMRLRVGLEMMLLFMAFLPLCVFSQKLLDRWKPLLSGAPIEKTDNRP
ncbi:hypothetical protein ACFL5V_01730 [Fibrobacterota bacterium]